MGKAVGAEGLVAGQIVDIKSEGMAEQVWVLLAPHVNEQLCSGKHPACLHHATGSCCIQCLRSPQQQVTTALCVYLLHAGLSLCGVCRAFTA